MADLERLPAVGYVELRVFRDRALVDAKDAKLSDVGVVDDLEHVREDMLLWIRRRAKLGTGGAFALVEERRVALGRIRQQLHADVEQRLDPGAGPRANETHRHQMTLAQRFLEWRVQFLRRD